jgi:pyruvate dehydrogenase E2 component (dihydrolipoamide acetyltransferase)
MADVTMPQLGETVADGTVTKWFKSVGDTVAKGEPLFEVSTDKVDTEIPAQADGILTAILVDEGETVDVGTVLAVIGGDGTPSSAPVQKVTAREERPSAPLAPVAPVAPVASTADREPDAKLSPVVRRLLAEHDLDASAIVGTGPGGRITRDDVDAAIQTKGASTRQPVSANDDVVPFTKIRRITAEHMVRSKATSAHTLMVREVDYEHVESVRRTFGAAFKQEEGFSLTYLAFNAVAAREALIDFPHLNATVGDNALIVHRRCNLGIAVDLDDEGLVVPVVKDANQHTVRSIARTIHELATRARAKTLGVDDMTEATFTISNPGPYGTLLTGAIINQPQVAILSTDAVTRRPVVVTNADGEESLAIRSIGLLALTFDHRAVDGAYAARFLRRVAQVLNEHDWAGEL